MRAHVAFIVRQNPTGINEIVFSDRLPSKFFIDRTIPLLPQYRYTAEGARPKYSGRVWTISRKNTERVAHTGRITIARIVPEQRTLVRPNPFFENRKYLKTDRLLNVSIVFPLLFYFCSLCVHPSDMHSVFFIGSWGEI